MTGNEASNEVVRGSREVSMYEMWKRKQKREKDWTNGDGAIWEVMTSSEEWTDRERY